MRRIVAAVLSIILAFTVVVPMTSCDGTESTFISDDVIIRNLVDERFEFVALAFRLGTWFPPLTATSSNYHRRLNARFSRFRDHEAIQAVSQSLTTFMDAFMLASNLEITDYGFALRCWDTYQSDLQLHRDHNMLLSIVDKLNDFHRESNFREFFNNEENQQYFMRLSRDHIRNVYRYINFEWFEQFGLIPDNMHVILMPSLVSGGFGASLRDADDNVHIAYAVLGMGAMEQLWVTIHEFAHSFGNALADQWIDDGNFDFWLLALDTSRRGPRGYEYSRNVRIMAYEYIVRSLTILYMLDNTNQRLDSLFQRDRNLGFRNIAEVFDMLMRYLGRYELIQSD